MDSRFFEKSPTMNMKKDDMIAFISTRGTEIPNPIPIKPVIFEKKLVKQISILWLKKTIIESHRKGMESIKTSQVSLHLNIFTSQPSKIVDLVRKVCKENISTKKWVNYTGHVVKE